MKAPEKARRPLPSLVSVFLGATLGILVLTFRQSVPSPNRVNLLSWTTDMLGLGASRAEALRNCTDFACVRRAHQRPGKFNFPHFLIIGFPKAATTSLHDYLKHHPQGLNPRKKEAQFFTGKGACWHPERTGSSMWGCGKAEVAYYLNHTMRLDNAVAAGLEKAAFESTTDYVWGGINMSGAVYDLAAGVRAEVPWVKLIVSMREPISHQISGKVHTLDMLKNPEWWFNPEEADECVRHLFNGKAVMYDCVKENVFKKDAYVDALNAWLAAFPPEQFHMVQYENLTGDATRAAVLDGVMRFLGMDPTLGPKELPLSNSRKAKAKPEGWPILKAQLDELIAGAEAKANSIADILEQHGYWSRADWMVSWRAAWDSYLATCDPSGTCAIVPN